MIPIDTLKFETLSTGACDDQACHAAMLYYRLNGWRFSRIRIFRCIHYHDVALPMWARGWGMGVRQGERGEDFQVCLTGLQHFLLFPPLQKIFHLAEFLIALNRRLFSSGRGRFMISW